jgi:hypothetical protein
MVSNSVMKTQILTITMTISALAFFCLPVLGQSNDQPVMSTPPVSTAERDAVYDAAIEKRTLNILKTLALSDAAKSNHVHDIFVRHYRALHDRDEAINEELSDLSKGSDEWRAQRDIMLLGTSQAFHQRFIAELSQELTPAQLDAVKDRLTYGKVQFTYNAYCSIVPNLTDEEKTNIFNLLIQAREVAMEGGSAGEKSDLFQHYKDQINSYLLTEGIDVPKATQEWSKRQAALQKSSGQTNSMAAPAVN